MTTAHLARITTGQEAIGQWRRELAGQPATDLVDVDQALAAIRAGRPGGAS